ncbi:MAG: T9SS type A sorting domain-containing protein [Muribaculaceae bacterium]|nr:T9SS type A sorting domain-containing protein [Muribaculaceae bacterium]
MRIIRTLIIGASVAMAGLSSTAAVTMHLRIHMTGGSTALINVGEKTFSTDQAIKNPEGEECPEVVFEGSKLIVTVPKTDSEPSTYTYEANDVESFDIVKYDQTVGIDGVVVKNAGAITAIGGGVFAVAGTEARVYDLNGRQMPVEATATDAGLTVSLASLQPGVYVIATESATLKVTKQ